MSSWKMLIAPLMVALLSLSAAAETPINPTPAPAPSDDAPAENNPEFHKILLDIGATYQTWGRVDDESRWAPFLCRMPLPSRVKMSDSGDEDTHGQKLYYLFAKDRDAYWATNPEKFPDAPKTTIGQTIVKQSWHPEMVSSPEKPADPDTMRAYQNTFNAQRDDGGSHHPYIEKEGTTYKASALIGLYVMTKLDPKTPGTDEGWVYGTLSPDGKTVTSSGRVASCMGCHTQVKGDRLFGFK